MTISKVGYGIPLSKRLSIVKAYAANPAYKPIIAVIVPTLTRMYAAGLYGVLAYDKLGADERQYENALKEQANAVLWMLTLKRGTDDVKVRVETVDITPNGVTATYAIKNTEGTTFATYSNVAQLAEDPGFASVWSSRLTSAKGRIIHGLQNTDYEIVKQLAIEGWYNVFGRHLLTARPDVVIKHRIGLSAVPGATIRDRATAAVKDPSYDAQVQMAEAKWRDKARIVLGAVNASADAVAWIIQETFAVQAVG